MGADMGVIDDIEARISCLKDRLARDKEALQCAEKEVRKAEADIKENEQALKILRDLMGFRGTGEDEKRA